MFSYLWRNYLSLSLTSLLTFKRLNSQSLSQTTTKPLACSSAYYRYWDADLLSETFLYVLLLDICNREYMLMYESEQKYLQQYPFKFLVLLFYFYCYNYENIFSYCKN